MPMLKKKRKTEHLVRIARRDDPEAKRYIEWAQSNGYTVMIERGERQSLDDDDGFFVIQVLNHGLVYRAKDAIFKPVRDGLYIFRDGKPVYVGS